MIDWPVAHRLAGLVAGHGRRLDAADDLPAIAVECEGLVADYTGLAAGGALPRAEAVSRTEWADLNLRGFRPLLDPVAERIGSGAGPLQGAVRAAGGAVIGAEVGLLTGYLSQRVLGQYEVALLDPTAAPRLVFVAENLGGAVESLKVDGDELVRWVALHEVTHALQFAGVPWLREHLGDLLRELLATFDVRIDPRALLRIPSGAELREWAERLRRDGLVALVASERQRAVLDRLQSAMAVVEGYAEHVMDAVGARLLDTLPELRAAMERRRRSRSPAEVLLQRLIGLDVKLRQYEVGKAFCDDVAAAGGIAAVNRAWASPEALPTLDELSRPSDWLARTGAAAA